MTNTLKLVSLNVRGVNNFHKRRTIFTWCRKRKADIIFLQETHLRKELEKQWMNEWGGKIFFSHGSPNSCGVAVLIRNGFNCVIKNTVIDPSGRFIVLKVNINDNLCSSQHICAKQRQNNVQMFQKFA